MAETHYYGPVLCADAAGAAAAAQAAAAAAPSVSLVVDGRSISATWTGAAEVVDALALALFPFVISG